MGVLLMPADILDNPFMLRECIDRSWLSRSKHRLVLYVPNTYQGVISSWEKVTLVLKVPVQPISFFRVSRQFDLRLHFVVLRGCWMFEVVENVNFARYRLGSDDVPFLRHWSCSIDFSLVIDLCFCLDSLSFCSKSMSILLVVMILWGFNVCIF